MNSTSCNPTNSAIILFVEKLCLWFSISVVSGDTQGKEVEYQQQQHITKRLAVASPKGNKHISSVHEAPYRLFLLLQLIDHNCVSCHVLKQC